MTACYDTAQPLLLISDLPGQTKNLLRDARASLLFDGTAGLDRPLTGARVTVIGCLAPTMNTEPVARSVARHLKVELYLSFADFRLIKITIERAHIVAGFGVIHWIDATDLLLDMKDRKDLAAAESNIVNHMTQEHSNEIQLYATKLLGRDTSNWEMTGIDPEGVDLRDGGEIARLTFKISVKDLEAARSILIRMLKAAQQ